MWSKEGYTLRRSVAGADRVHPRVLSGEAKLGHHVLHRLDKRSPGPYADAADVVPDS